jgi:TM2 domain-containing membrane protein YozV
MNEIKYVTPVVQASGKSTFLAYILWWFLGFIGVHRFYLGRTGSGVTMLLLAVFGTITLPVGVGMILLSVLGIWWFVDLFLTYGLVQNTYTAQVAPTVIVNVGDNTKIG